MRINYPSAEVYLPLEFYHTRSCINEKLPPCGGSFQ